VLNDRIHAILTWRYRRAVSVLSTFAGMGDRRIVRLRAFRKRNSLFVLDSELPSTATRARSAQLGSTSLARSIYARKHPVAYTHSRLEAHELTGSIGRFQIDFYINIEPVSIRD